jgi:hypothetical protein
MSAVSHMIEALNMLNESVLDDERRAQLDNIVTLIDDLVYSNLVQLKNFPEGFKISTMYPYAIIMPDRSIMKEYKQSAGYIVLKYKGKTYFKHKIVAEQFIENPDRHCNVLHVNGDKTDNHIENLRWCYNKRSSLAVMTLEEAEKPVEPVYQQHKCYSKIEIQVEYPHRMRYVDTKMMLREETRNIVMIEFDSKMWLKHRLVAEHFLDNPCDLKTSCQLHGNTVMRSKSRSQLMSFESLRSMNTY